MKKMIYIMNKMLAVIFVLSVQIHAYAAPQSTVLVVGDSISAAYNMEYNQGWVALLQDHLNATYVNLQNFQVVNVSVAGETARNAQAKLPGLLEKHQPNYVIIELGGNDGLRGYPIDTIKQSLTAMVKQSQKFGADVVLVQMQIPTNYGRKYTEAFRDVFVQVAAENTVLLTPFILADIFGKEEMMQKDGIHPTAKAQPLILQKVFPILQVIIDSNDSKK